MSRLTQILGLLYRMSDYEVEGLAVRLLDQRKQAWRDAIRAEARPFGYTGAARGPSREDLSYLRRLSQNDAKKISQTWARDVERQLDKLYDANPKGNRHYYIKNMESWATAREDWKSRQIAVNTEFTTAAYARDRFWTMNNMLGGKFVFAGPPPVCQDCVEMFALGVVPYSVVQANQTPRHINCPHYWTLIRGSVPKLSPQDIWVG